MAPLTIVVRPKSGYNAPKKTKRVTVDTSDRVEEILSSLRLEKKGTRFFDIHGKELPLNSSLASHNIQDNDILEACAAPKLSAVLSAVLRDFDAVSRVPELERTEQRLRPLLGVDGNKRHLLEPWPDRWSHDDIKTRTICLATIKKIIQRQDRFEETQVPHMDNLHSLYHFIQPLFQRTNSRGHNAMAHVVKPTSRNRDGKPTTCWELLQNKLDQMSALAARGPRDQDVIEEFVKLDAARHGRGTGRGSTPGSATPRGRSSSTPSSTNAAGAAAAPPPASRERARRRLQLEPSPAVAATSATTRNSTNRPPCNGCGSSPADSVCLTDDCPFHKHLYCTVCFHANHPILQRNHERVDLLTDVRAKEILKQKRKASTTYIPEYASGPFSVLATLVEVSTPSAGSTRAVEYSLSESRLKKLAQARCRSNLYDTQVRGGRNAFAGAETLADKGYLRKEIIPDSLNREARFSLLPPGEALGKCCLAFERGLKTALHTRAMVRERSLALNNGGTRGEGAVAAAAAAANGVASSSRIRLIIDNREDATYADRLVERCQDNQISHDRRDLPTGDYIFTVPATEGGTKEIVLPLVIERKSWSDLADSVMGRGQRRLDCVRVGAGSQCQGSCQLCRMKRSGCGTLMFIIEGLRCLGRDLDDKCTNAVRCKHCEELALRHGEAVVQEELEKKVLQELQCEHGCIIHFTNGYNETIDSLLWIRSILDKQQMEAASDLTYQQFCSNARSSVASSKTPTRSSRLTRGEAVVLSVHQFVRRIREGNVKSSVSSVAPSASSSAPSSARTVTELINLDDTDEERQEERAKDRTKNSRVDQECISLDSDDDENDVQLVGSSRPAKKARLKNENEVILLDDGPADGTIAISRRKARSGSGTKLVLIPGLLEYDNEYKDDTNKIWKALYKSHSIASTQEFEDTIANKLKSVCTVESNKSPLVPRDFILFWSLFIQIQMGVRLHFVRLSNGVESLRSAWLGRLPRHAASMGRASHHAAIDVGSNRRSPAPRRQLDFDEGTVECLICKQQIQRKYDEWATPCGHFFHRDCLTNWMEGSNTRKCPQCNVDGIGMPKQDDDHGAPKNGSSARKRKDPPRANDRPPRALKRTSPSHASETDAAIREARLRRFGGGQGSNQTQAATTAAHGTLLGSDRMWNCIACTLQNEESSMFCCVCEAQRPGVAPIAAATTNQIWKCPKCTLENHPDAGKCEACFHIRSTYSPAAYATPRQTERSSAASRPSSSSQTSVPTGTNNATAKRTIRCGACKQEGHNRSSATAENCIAYFDSSEIEARRVKKVEAQRKARELREQTSRLEQTQREKKEAEERRNEELKRLVEETQRNTAEVNRLQAEEAKRLKKKAERAEKRARKLAGNG